MKKDLILVLIVLALSSLNIFNHRSDLYSFTVLLSVLGILGCMAYILKLKLFEYLILAWILLQFPIIEFKQNVSDSHYIVSKIFDASQAFNLKLGFGFFKPNPIFLYLNFLPFIYLILFQFLVNKSIISKLVSIIPLTENSLINKFAPLDGVITDISNKSEIIVKLNKTILIENIRFDKLKFKTSDRSIFKLKKERQECEINLVPNNIKDKEISTLGFIK